jgi:hypothetical protein
VASVDTAVLYSLIAVPFNANLSASFDTASVYSPLAVFKSSSSVLASNTASFASFNFFAISHEGNKLH